MLPDLTPHELLGAFPGAVILLDDAARLTYVNDLATAIIRRPAAEILGRRVMDALPGAAGTRTHAAVDRALDGGTPVQLTEHFRSVDAWFSVRVVPVRGGLAVFFHEVTELKLEERRVAAYAEVQGVLRRVATAVAAEGAPDAVQLTVCAEAARLVDAHSAWLVSFTGTSSYRVLGAQVPEGFELPARGDELDLLPGSELERVARTGEPVIAPDGVGGRLAGSGMRATVIVPVHREEAVWGALCVAWTEAQAPDAAEAVRAWLADLADLVSLALGNAEARAELARRATTDPLTRVANLRLAQDTLDRAVGRGRRHDHPLTLALVDVDHFKAVNDSSGHVVGDRVLRTVAEELARATRTEDLVARVGGDEFAVILDGTDAPRAARALDRVRAGIAEALELRGLPPVTLSAGLCSWEPGLSREGLHRRADDALHWAKLHGRDGVVAHDPARMEQVADAERPPSATVEVERRLRSAQGFWQSALDALSRHVGVLNEAGEVIAVNEAWRRHARAAVGSAYPAQLDRIGRTEPWGAEAARGLREVLEGRRESFEVEYEASGRWFRTRGDRFATRRPLRVIVQHEDITERQRQRRDLEAARDHLAAVTSSMGDGLLLVGPDGRIGLANAAAAQLLGRDGLSGMDVRTALYGGADGLLGRRLAPRRGAEDEFVRADGGPMPVTWTASPLGSGDRGEHVVVFQDATERRHRELRLRREADGLRWAARIRRALDQDQFVLLAQPIVDLGTSEVAHHELLLRLRDGQGGHIPPSDFLPAAEDHGLMAEVDTWVLRRAVETAAAGRPVHVNLSAQSVGDAGVLRALAEAVATSAVDPSAIVVEVTETALLEHGADPAGFLRALRDIGCGVALDDFGTGYNGFARVKQLPADILKIDQQFVLDLLDDPASASVIRAIVGLAADLGVTVVAEGIEDAATLARVRELGVRYGQGHHLGRPAPLR